jgi:pimeloyl-ACP methyl ester carboxylesterase
MSSGRRWRGETRDLDDAARREATGSYINLSQGHVHYEIGARRGDAAVVLIHGFSVPYFVWDPTFVALTQAGIPTLRYDLYGRGFSDRPDLRYDMRLFVRQLEELVECLELKRVGLVGLSMGGPIAATFAGQQAHRVTHVTFIDPTGIGDTPLGTFYKAAALPVIGEFILSRFGTQRLVELIASDFYAERDIALFKTRYQRQMEFAGFKRAILSTVRSRMLGDFSSDYAKLGKMTVPCMVIWGKQDRSVPLSRSQGLLDLVPHAELHAVPDAGHVPHFEKPEMVNPWLLQFFESFA